MMAKRPKPSLWYSIALLSLLLHHHLSLSSAASPPSTSHQLEGFSDELEDEPLDDPPIQLTDLPPPPSITKSDPQTRHGPPGPSDLPPTKREAPAEFEYWDEDEFEGLPTKFPDEPAESTEQATPSSKSGPVEIDLPPLDPARPFTLKSYPVEIFCICFLVAFLVNYFVGKRQNEKLAMAWAAKFAARNSVFEKNFSLMGVGEGRDSPLLLKEGNNEFKFYASGRRYCQGLSATMELQSRHDLLSRLYNVVVPCKDEISFEVYMNDEAMDHVILAVAKRTTAKGLLKETPDLQRYASLMSPPSSRKWVSEKLTVISESKEVAADLITEAVLDQVFGENAFEKYGKLFISMHFSDQYPGTLRKKLMFKFALPHEKNMIDITGLIALVPYYVDLVGRYKLSSQGRANTDAARAKAAQEAYKGFKNTTQEAMQKKKAERRKMMEEVEAKLSVEAIRRKEAKEKARQMKKATPKIKMSRG